MKFTSTIANPHYIVKDNPVLHEWIASYKWCVTSDFDSKIECTANKDNKAYIIGTGNIDFYTTQSGF